MKKTSNVSFILTGLGVSLVLALFLSPFSSKHPDGLDKVAEDLNFAHKATSHPVLEKLPFAGIFTDYQVKNLPQKLSTPIAGVCGVVLTFSLVIGLGKFLEKKPNLKE